MTDQFLEAFDGKLEQVRSEVRAVDREIAEFAGRIENLQDQRRLQMSRLADLEWVEATYVSTRSMAPTHDDLPGDRLGLSASEETEPAPPAAPTRRRNVRAEVLDTITKRGTGISPNDIGRLLGVQRAQVDLATAWYGDPKRGQITLREGLWYATAHLMPESVVAEILPRQAEPPVGDPPEAEERGPEQDADERGGEEQGDGGERLVEPQPPSRLFG